MRKIKKQFTDSLYELKELRTLVAAAMLLAACLPEVLLG